MKFGKWTTPTLLLSCSFHAPALLLLYSSPAPASALPLPYSCPAPAVVLPCSRQAPIRHIPNSSPGPAQLLPNRGCEDQRKFVSAWKVLKVCSKEYTIKGGSRRAEKSRKVLMMMKAAKLGRAGQEQTMSRPGAGWEHGKRRAGALAVHIPNFIQIVLKT